MATCFLFLDALEPEGFLCLHLNDSHAVDAPFMRRTADEIIALQANSKTIVVIPTGFASIVRLALPWFGERKAREALPFALEEELASPVSELHFAFDRAHYQAGAYCVVVVNKLLLQQWLDALKAQRIVFDTMTLDWFALNEGEALITDNSLLVYDVELWGSLSPELAEIFLNQSQDLSGYVFSDSVPMTTQPNWTYSDDVYASFVAKRLANQSILNVCQGDFKHEAKKNTRLAPWYYGAGLLFGLWIIIFLSLDLFKLYRLASQEKVYDQKISSIYHTFFPEATEVVQPKMRIEALLKSNAFIEQGGFWSVLASLSLAFHADEIEIKSISFQGDVTLLTLVSQNFTVLEKFEEQLRRSHVQVKQIDASTHIKEVHVTLELKA